MYENKINWFGHEVTINKEIFRTKIMNCFESYGIQHMNDEYKNAFTFPDGIKRIKCFKHYQEAMTKKQFCSQNLQ